MVSNSPWKARFPRHADEVGSVGARGLIIAAKELIATALFQSLVRKQCAVEDEFS